MPGRAGLVRKLRKSLLEIAGQNTLLPDSDFSRDAAWRLRTGLPTGRWGRALFEITDPVKDVRPMTQLGTQGSQFPQGMELEAGK